MTRSGEANVKALRVPIPTRFRAAQVISACDRLPGHGGQGYLRFDDGLDACRTESIAHKPSRISIYCYLTPAALRRLMVCIGGTLDSQSEANNKEKIWQLLTPSPGRLEARDTKVGTYKTLVGLFKLFGYGHMSLAPYRMRGFPSLPRSSVLEPDSVPRTRTQYK